ncbi:MAG: DegV family protein [Chloroflexota bacterium]
MPRILVMADSTCDIPAAWVKQHDIRIVPTYVHFGQESLADDGVQLTRETFYRRLSAEATLPTTAAPPLGQAVEVLSGALRDADQVIAICAPAALSGIFNIFRLAAEQTDPARVTVIDSQMVTMGLGWHVMEAVRLAGRGAAPAEIEARLVALQPRADVYAALDTFEFLRRSGRVGWATAFFGSFLQVKPLIRLHLSVVSSQGRVRTRERAFSALVDFARQAAPLEQLAILHTANPDGAGRLSDALADLHPPDRLVPIVEVTPVIGVHVGPNGLGIAIIRQNEPAE